MATTYLACGLQFGGEIASHLRCDAGPGRLRVVTFERTGQQSHWSTGLDRHALEHLQEQAIRALQDFRLKRSYDTPDPAPVSGGRD